MAKKRDKVLQTDPEHWDDMFHREFEGESDRASVILAAAMLELAVETLLRARLAPTSTAEDSLFDSSNAPLANFSVKIELAYRVGLIPNNIARDLHLIRRIRNSFAHDIAGCTFDAPSVVGRVTELIRSQGVLESAPHLRSGYSEGRKGDFQMTVSWLLWHLWTKTQRVQGIKPLGDVTARDMAAAEASQSSKTKKPSPEGTV